jgi:hypothetical protein
MVTLSDAPVVAAPFTRIPTPLLFVMTLLSTPEATADPVGETKIPSRAELLLEAIVLDTEKLLDVLRKIAVPREKFRTTQFSMARFPPVLNLMPSSSR